MPSLTNDEYTINIKTTADTAGATKAEDALKKVGHQTQQVDEKSKSAGGGMGGLVGQFAAGNIAANLATNAFSGLKNQFMSTIGLAEQQQNAQAQLNNALKSTGDASGMTIQGLNGIAESTQKTTTFSKLDTEQAETTMLTYTNIGKNVFPQTMTAAENMATRFGISLPNASKLLGRALNDPAHGMTALTRYLGTLSPAMQQNIKDMEASGNSAGAQALLIDQLNHKMGGAAATAAQTFSGKMAQMKNRIDDAKIAIGTGLMHAATKVFNYFSGHKQVLEAIGFALAGIGLVILISLAPAIWGAVTAFAAMALAALPFIAAGIAIGLIAFEVVKHWKTLKKWFDDLWKDLKQWFKDGVNFIKQNWELLAGILVLPLLPVLLLWKYFHKQITKIFTEAVADVMRIWNAIIGFFSSVWNGIKIVFNVVKGWIVDFFKDEYNGIINIWNGITGFFSGLWNGIKATVSKIGTILSGAFRDAFNAIIGLWDNTMGKIFHGQKIGIGPVHFDLPNLNIPKMALGGIVTKPTIAMIGEAGSEAVIPLSKLGSGGSLGMPSSSNNVDNSQQSQTTINIQHVSIASPEAAKEWFNQLNGDSTLVRNGLTPSQGMA